MKPIWFDFPVKGDDRGRLIAIESARELPFPIRRTYFLYDTVAGVTRGRHAHRRLRQAAVCVKGSLTMLLDDGRSRTTFRMDRPDKALLLDPMVWHEMSEFSPDCVLMVLADNVYIEADYIRSYDEFLTLVRTQGDRPMAPRIHPTAEVSTPHIGDGTSIWQHCVVLEGAVIGRDCNICAHCFIEQDVVLGDRVTVKSGVYLWNGARIEDDVFIGPNVTFCNDKFPRSKQRPDRFQPIHVRKGASIGAGAILLPGIVVGENAMVGAGAVVTRDVPPGAVVAGNPATPLRAVSPVGSAPASRRKAG